MTSLRLQRTPTKDLSEDELMDLVDQNKGIYEEYFDEDYTISLEKNIFEWMNIHYFRAEFIGFENYPERNDPDRPLIFISNHSGMAFPWDAMVFGAGVFKMHGHKFKNAVRGLSAPMLSESTLMNPYLIKDFWKRVGAIDATSLNFETMMHFNESHILLYPEGVPGIGKGFNNKYQLQRFSSSFIRMSLKYKTDVVPVYTVNGEYINPYSYKSERVNRISKKIGVPFIPLSLLVLLIPLQPWLFYFAFPANLKYVMGEKISPYKWIDKPLEELSLDELRALSEKVRQEMQIGLTKAVEEHGRKPFKFGQLFLHNIKNIGSTPYFFSPGWPVLFADHERRYKKAKDKGEDLEMKLNFFSILRAIIMNPFAIFFFIPILGWIPIVIKGYSDRSRLKVKD